MVNNTFEFIVYVVTGYKGVPSLGILYSHTLTFQMIYNETLKAMINSLSAVSTYIRSAKSHRRGVWTCLKPKITLYTFHLFSRERDSKQQFSNFIYATNKKKRDIGILVKSC